MKWMMLMASLVLVGCGTSGQVRTQYSHATADRFAFEVVNTGEMSPEGLGIFRKQLDLALSAQGKLAAAGDPAARKVRIEITHYRMRHGATRALVGILAGKDSITSTVKILDDTGKVIGETEVDSGNATAWGTSHGLIEGHADEIVAFLTGKPR